MSTATADWTTVAEIAIHEYHAVQKACELTELLALLDREVKPRTVLEIGSDLGGSLYAWSRLPSVERIYAVTLPVPMNYHLQSHGGTVVYGDSHESETRRRLDDLLKSCAVDFLFIDGDHSALGVVQDLTNYQHLVSKPGGLCVLHDIVVHPQFPDCRVFEIWRELPLSTRLYQPHISEIVHEPRTWGGYGLIRW